MLSLEFSLSHKFIGITFLAYFLGVKEEEKAWRLKLERAMLGSLMFSLREKERLIKL